MEVNAYGCCLSAFKVHNEAICDWGWGLVVGDGWGDWGCLGVDENGCCLCAFKVHHEPIWIEEEWGGGKLLKMGGVE